MLRISFSRSRHLIASMVCTLGTASWYAPSLAAQALLPPLGPVSARSPAATEQVRGTRVLKTLADPEVAWDNRPNNPLDSALSQQARVWVKSLESAPVKGIQLDAFGELLVVGNQDAAAQRQFAARLATPGLLARDRAFTLGLAVSAFAAQPLDTMRMRMAGDYLKQLDGLTSEAARYQYYAHMRMAGAYYTTGSSSKLVTHILAALDRVPAIPFQEREVPMAEFYWLADALSGQPNGRAQIDSLGRRWLGLLQATPEMLAQDRIYARYSNDRTYWFETILKFTNFLGRKAPPIVAQYWWNSSAPSAKSELAPDATALRLDDGKIRLIELGSLSCHWCLVALQEMEQIHVTVSQVETWYVTQGYGLWGSKSCTAEFEADRLKFTYLTQMKRTLPIALWIGPRVGDPDGGSLVPPNPMWAEFGVEGGPMFFITDGHGVVRHVGTNSVGLVPERRVLQFLLAEAGHTPQS